MPVHPGAHNDERPHEAIGFALPRERYLATADEEQPA